MPSTFKCCTGSALFGFLLCTLFATSVFASDTVRTTSIDRYLEALKVDPDNPTLHYILGLAELKNGNAAEALVSFRNAYPSYTDSIEMHYNMGLAFSQLADADSALLYLEQAEALGALELGEVFPLVNAYYNVGLLYLEQESLSEAEALFKKILRLDPERVEIFRLLGDIAARNGQTEDAVSYLSEYLTRYPEDQSAREYLYALHFNRGLKLMETGNNQAAQSAFESAREVAPDSPLIQYYLGSLAYNSGDTGAALQLLAPAYATVPAELKQSTRSMLYNSVLRCLDTGQLEQALAGIAPLVMAPNPQTKDLMLAGSIHLKRRDFTAARNTFNRVLSSDPTHAQAMINLAAAEDKAIEELFQAGLVNYKQDRYLDALANFDAVLEIQPDERRSKGYRQKTLTKIESGASEKFSSGRKALEQKDYLQAITLANDGLSLNPNDATGLLLKSEALQGLNVDINQLVENGLALLQREDFAAAEAQFGKVLQIDPDHRKAQHGLIGSAQSRQAKALAEVTLGEQALDEGKLEKSRQHFAAATNLMPTLAEALEGRARLEALTASLVAQEMQWGRLARSAGDLNKAESHFKNAQKLTNTPEARRELETISLARSQQTEGLLTAARTARKKNDVKTARSLYARILETHPHHPAATELNALNAEIAAAVAVKLNLAEKLSAREQYREAVDLYRQTLELEPGNRKAQQGLDAGRNQIKTTIATYLQAGRSALEQGNLQAAASAYDQALQVDPYQADARAAITTITRLQQAGIRPGDEDRLYLQGIELYTQGKYSEAIRVWEQVLRLEPEHNKATLNIEKAKRKLQSIQEFQSG